MKSDKELTSGLGGAIQSISPLPETLGDGTALADDIIPLSSIRSARESITNELKQIQELSPSLSSQEVRNRISRILIADLETADQNRR